MVSLLYSVNSRLATLHRIWKLVEIIVVAVPAYYRGYQLPGGLARYAIGGLAIYAICLVALVQAGPVTDLKKIT